MTVLYDGSFEGFLTLVYEVYYSKLKPKKISKEPINTLFVHEIQEIQYEEKKAEKVLSALKSKFPKQALQTILNSFLCDSKEYELDLLHYIILGFKDTDELNNINNSCVFKLQNLEKELYHINHKMTGFVRFEELEDGTLYAKIDTKYNLVYLLGQHFLKRLNNQNYIIHDIKRELAFVKIDDQVEVKNVVEFEEPNLSQDEQKFKKLWLEFFQATNIESRKNKKCQQNLVPLLYRTYMTEFQETVQSFVSVSDSH